MRVIDAVGFVDGAVVGAVRLYPLDADGLWKGDRLAVVPEARVRHVGALLVLFAVATAGALGGHRMVARVQLPNVRFFERLGWQVDGVPEPYVGVMHQATILRPDPQQSRIVNSTMLGLEENGAGKKIAPETVVAFLTDMPIARPNYS